METGSNCVYPWKLLFNCYLLANQQTDRTIFKDEETALECSFVPLIINKLSALIKHQFVIFSDTDERYWMLSSDGWMLFGGAWRGGGGREKSNHGGLFA